MTRYTQKVYACGLKAGDLVRLKRDLIVRDSKGKRVGIHLKGEIWRTLRGSRQDPGVVWFRQPDGKEHTWDDVTTSKWAIQRWFDTLPRHRNRELVDLSPYGFVLEPRYWFYGWSRTPKIRLRRAVAEQLARSRLHLPPGFNLKVWDGYRTYDTQVLMIASFRKRLICANPDLSEAEREKLVWRYAAKPKKRVTRPDAHRTGGAVDLTIVDRDGRELDMGTDHDALVPEAALDFYERRPGRIRDNRRLLKKAMRAAGFLTYAPEWWHFSSKS